MFNFPRKIVNIKKNARYGWNVLGTCVIIGKASRRVLTFLRAFVRDFIRDFDLHILFKSNLALHNKREFITYFATRWETWVFITRPKREKTRESPSASRKNRKGKCFYFSSLLFPLFLLFFPMNFWILLNHCKFASPFRNDLSLKFKRISFFLINTACFMRSLFFLRIS